MMETSSNPVFREPFPILYVADVARSARFYTELLGFRQTFTWDAAGTVQFAYLRLGSTGIGLGARSGVPWADGGTAAERGRTFELCIYVDDVDLASARLLAAGVAQVAPPETKPWGERLTYFLDPDGNPLHITMVLPEGNHAGNSSDTSDALPRSIGAPARRALQEIGVTRLSQ
ncbi:MAG: hypothetical protein DCC58_15175, partial [Chloroflexi bacterium]